MSLPSAKESVSAPAEDHEALNREITEINFAGHLDSEQKAA